MTSEFWGIFDLDRQDFASRSLGHGGEYIDTILHHSSHATVESWLDGGSFYYGNRAEVRLIGPEYADRMRGCICLEHRKRDSSGLRPIDV